ncbi:hypothetical protein BDW02DRAFT_604750 [Decorospora gaudefroyi]|uniref:Uncharacterized protein n=1 Tax=Decorospora gaudefroyi TaxID=184978 RepID=A0A6A5KSV6_9PLEO|nr:hypothetical protein BDW02DRAFT_604750 [Decorospora gaudefroyi]
MAAGSKKRRTSRSPDRATASKRARVPSASASVPSEEVARGGLSSRATSAKDPYFLETHERAASLPIGADWLFRVKVISSSADLSDDVFEAAVHGLVELCFPDNILDRLGTQILEQHMRKEKAPQENIQRAAEVFRSKLIQRVPCVLSQYLATPAKVDSAVRATIAANPTEWLANLASPQDAASSSSVIDPDNASEEQGTPPPEPKKEKNRHMKSRDHSSIGEDALNDAEMDIDIPETPLESTNLSSASVPRTSKDRKISSKWNWDIDLANLSDNAVPEAFSRTSDLFAYHALLIIRRKLGPEAMKKEVRHEMQAMLEGMSDSEFEKWTDSLQKLLDGDREMLVRSEPAPSQHNQQLSRTTPAPIDMRRRAKKAVNKAADGLSQLETNMVGASQKRTFIKREAGVSSNAVKAMFQDQTLAEPITEATVALRHLSTEERDFENSHVTFRDRMVGSKLIVAKGATDSPILDLLCGPMDFTLANMIDIRQNIMDSLDKRLSAESVAVQNLDGSNTIQSKTKLRGALESINDQWRNSNITTVKRKYEYRLVDWVWHNPLPFWSSSLHRLCLLIYCPATRLYPIIFSDPVPHYHQEQTEPEDRVLIARMRGGMETILYKPESEDMKRRALLEKVMRRTVFPQKAMFPQLKFTPVVRAWERMTGQTW